MMALRDGRWRILLVLPVLAGAVALIIWHGPNWSNVQDAFTLVRWEWVAAAIGLNLLSVVTRAYAWDTAIKQSIARPHPRFPLVFSAFSVGLFANAVLPGRVGELARVAVPEAATLVPPSDPDALAAAVVDMLGDEDRRVEMGRAARAHAIANYDWDDIARRLEETYLEAAA